GRGRQPRGVREPGPPLEPDRPPCRGRAVRPATLMDNLRIFLWVGLLLMFWMLIQAWQQDQRISIPAAEQAAQTESPSPEELLPSLPSASDGAPAMPGLEETAPPASPTVHVRTDVLDIGIDPVGATLVEAVLPEYPVHKDHPD